MTVLESEISTPVIKRVQRISLRSTDAANPNFSPVARPFISARLLSFWTRTIKLLGPAPLGFAGLFVGGGIGLVFGFVQGLIFAFGTCLLVEISFLEHAWAGGQFGAQAGLAVGLIFGIVAGSFIALFNQPGRLDE